MTVAIALIRGINVGGKHRLPMSTLRSLCEKLGWKDVATLLQSGNVVFRCAERALVGVARKLEEAVEVECGFRAGVVVRSHDEVRAMVAANPFASKRGLEPNKLLVMFLAAAPDTGASKALAALKAHPEELVLKGREHFMYYPDGVGQSKLPFTAVERALKVSGTTRNWNTVTKLLTMAGDLESAD